MLGFIRESMQGWIAWAIIGLITVPFALWGIQEYFGGGGPLVIATVNGEEISQRSFQQEFGNQRERARQMLGGQYNPDLLDKTLKQQALDGLIERKLLFQAAKDNGFGVAEGNVKTYIENIEAFQEDGKFSKQQYERVLRSQDESPTGFEQRVQQGILTQQLYTGLVNSAIATPAELEKLVGLEEQAREVAYIQIPFTKYQNKDPIPDDELKKYYQEHLQEFMTEEQVSIQYIELDAKTIQPDEKPTDEQLRAYYKERQGQFTSNAERRTSHILITVDEGADEKTIQAAKDKATEIKAKLNKGESFKKLAEKYSQDPGSAKQGGDIGFFGKGSLDPNYEKTMFAMKVGEISEPVLSAFGFHIIKLDEIHESKTKTFEEVRADLEKEYSQSSIDNKYYKQADKLTNLAYENADTLEDAAGAIGAQIKTTPFFTRRGGPGIAANPKVASAAFSAEVLQQRYNSEPIELGENHVVVLRIKEHKDKSQKPFEAVKAIISTKIQNQNAKQAAKEAGEKTVEKLRTGFSDELRKQVASELKLEWKQEAALKRKDTKLNPQLTKAIFKAKHPSDGKPIIKGMQLSNGDYAIYALIKVVDGKIADVDEAKKKTNKSKLTGAYGETDFNQFLSGLKDAANIYIKPDSI